MQTPVEIAFRYCEPSDEIRSEIAAQVQRLEKFSPRITSCRVVVPWRRAFRALLAGEAAVGFP